MQTLAHISTLYSDSWVAWTLCVLMFIALLNRSSEMNIMVALRGISSHSERIYTSKTQSWISIITSRLFCFGIVAMAMTVLVYTDEIIRFEQYMLALGIVGLGFMIKALLMQWVGYVFVPMKKVTNAMEQYRILCMLTCRLLFPVVLIAINFPSPLLARTLCGIVGGIYALVLFWKCMQLFYHDMLSIVYILLYFVLLEILPLATMLFLTQYVIDK